MILGIMGQSGSGKDTMAAYLAKKHGFTRIAFADPLKRACKDFFEFSDNQLWGEPINRNNLDMRFPTGTGHLSPRIALQTLGTEWGRALYEDLWVDHTLRMMLPILNGERTYDKRKGLTKPRLHRRIFRKKPNGIVIPDVRFKNEAKKIQRAGGRIVRLNRVGYDGNVGIKNHSSEKEQQTILDAEIDYVLFVPEGISAFHRAIEDFLVRLPGAY